MAVFTKEQMLEMFEGNSTAQSKVKAIFQGYKLAEKPEELKADSAAAAKQMILDRIALSPADIVVEAYRKAKRHGVSHDEVIAAIEALYKEKVNAKINERIAKLQAKLLK